MRKIKRWIIIFKVFVMNILKVVLGLVKNIKDTAKELVESVKEGINEDKSIVKDNFKIELLNASKEIIKDKEKRIIIGNITIAFAIGIMIFGIGIRLS